MGNLMIKLFVYCYYIKLQIEFYFIFLIGVSNFFKFTQWKNKVGKAKISGEDEFR